MMKKMGANKSILFLVTGIILILSFKFDLAIVKFIINLRNPLLDAFMLWITYAGSTISILFILTSLLLWHEHKRRWILPLWLSLFSSVALTGIIKILVDRTRPYVLNLSTLPMLAGTVAFNTSFPSSHAAVAFSALPILDREFPYFRVVWFGFALLVAFSRMYFALHYPSDVLVGAILGYFIGLTIVRIEERYKISKNLLKRR